MVRESLKKFIGKYPYFLDKNPGSVFYRTSDVNNRGIQRLYNELFKVYESFHIGKRLLIWREQTEDYNYNINFIVNYPNLKEVSIYKDDILIYFEEFNKEDEVNNFEYTYQCIYTHENLIPSQAYQCNECGTIEISKFPIHKCRECENTNITPLQTYQCSECNEIYFKTSAEKDLNCTKNNHHNTLKKTNIYKCNNCGEIHFSDKQPVICEECNYGLETLLNENNTLTYEIYPVNDTNLEEYNTINLQIYDNETLITETSINKNNQWYTTIQLPYNQNYTINTINNNNDLSLENLELYFQIKGNINTNLTVPSYYDDESINCLDNRNVHQEKEYINNLYKQYTIKYKNITENIEIPINIIVDDDKIIDNILLNKENNYTINTKTLPTFNTDNGHIYHYKFEYDTRYDLNITETPIYTMEELVNIGDEVKLHNEIPIIPSEKFKIEVTTYDEYYLVKGYPENDTPELTDKGMPVNSIYDHDSSLDSFGELNNIPRKKYNIIDDYLLYPFTEPPYNNRASEDDYHYMNRILEYNLRLWGDVDLLYNLGYLSQEDYTYYKEGIKKPVVNFNPVSLELWKIYGLESELINRERYLLKVFDETKHPFDETTGLVKCWTPHVWEHKDRFCNYHKNVKPYFFVTASNHRPLIYESVDFNFKLLDSLGDSVDLDYYVNVYKLTSNGYNLLFENITKDTLRLDGSYFNTDGTATNLLFVAFNSKSFVEIGSCDVSVIVRDSSHADWYVDQYANINSDGTGVNLKYLSKGSRNNPFLTLQEALDNVSVSNDLICILSDKVNIPYTLNITKNTNIIGVDGEVTSIVLDSDERRFFNIIGGKNCKLKLGDINLKNNTLTNSIELQEWYNNSKDLNSLENVMVNGGTVELIITPSYKSIGFPFDFLLFNIKVVKLDSDVGVANQQVRIYSNDRLIDTVVTDEDGEFDYLFNLKEYLNGVYHFTVMNKSDLHFESQVTASINAQGMKDADYRYPVIGGQVTINITDYPSDSSVNVFDDNGEVVTVLHTDDDGVASETITNIGFSKQVWYTTYSNNPQDKVRDEWIIESEVHLYDTNLIGKTLIKDVRVDDSMGYFDITYDTVTITNESLVSDLEGVLLDLYVSNGEFIVEEFDSNNNDTDRLLYSDVVLLKNCILEDGLIFNDDGLLTVNHMEEII